jgi:nickel/cobalt transporter (NicO) family protein
MDNSAFAVCATAAGVGLIHTLAGPDHYVPFLALGRAGGWSARKTLAVTVGSGLAHVASSVLLGLLGIVLGVAIARLEALESARGDVVGWLFLGFGLAYTLWGIRVAIRSRPHSHLHVHADGTVHDHEHGHSGAHVHVHAAEPGAVSRVGPWTLFLLFALGPCEPLIPLMMLAAAQQPAWVVAMVAILYGVATLAAMIGVVALGLCGARQFRAAWLSRCSHALAGASILACGVAIQAGL